jgi:hypothetical protein
MNRFPEPAVVVSIVRHTATRVAAKLVVLGSLLAWGVGSSGWSKPLNARSSWSVAAPLLAVLVVLVWVALTAYELEKETRQAKSQRETP